ncbi:MAG: YafY family transcriptional regulator [Clostridiales bacterium]|nr:YafY family transcriptional regulator [Clostridiales bacterium]
MKFSILIAILFDLLAKRKMTATYLAEKYEISQRTVYRYIDLMSTTIPVYVKRGRNGGIYISDNYKLPVGFMTKDEYEAAIEALSAMYSQLPQERFLDAKRKLSAQVKAEARDLTLSGDVGNILVDGGTWGDTRTFSEKVHLVEECIRDRILLEIEYHSRVGEKTQRRIEPHVLVFKQGVWYVFAFCHKQRAFRLFRLGRIVATLKTDETFTKRPFAREDIPLNYWTNEKTVTANFEIDDNAFADAQDWLGVENMQYKNGKWQAEVTLPDDESLVRKIVSLGAGMKVVAPKELCARVAEQAAKISALYQ